ncbi:unnamed protein product [Rangifer tarandus platyrhynchus]|uniref:Uncharacterized protein n=1 Tax=Rangifer tarandus platyrhynchus TaxID=3082113 RepID=A0ABN8YB71_RANTA|nr:unnamed protein product [Rangifer tarandus platyrhynchus]
MPPGEGWSCFTEEETKTECPHGNSRHVGAAASVSRHRCSGSWGSCVLAEQRPLPLGLQWGAGAGPPSGHPPAQCDSRAQQSLADGWWHWTPGATGSSEQQTLLGVGEAQARVEGPPELSEDRGAKGEGEAPFLRPPSSPALPCPYLFQLQLLKAPPVIPQLMG